MKRTYLFVLSCLCPFLLSCGSLRQEIDPDRLNREASKLVVTCFLSPQDTVLAVKVNRSQPVLGDEPEFGLTATDVKDAVTTLSSGSKSVVLVYNRQLGYYRASSQGLPVVVGQTYTLTVQTPAGEQATAACTIPGPVNLASLAFDSLIDNQFSGQSKRYFVRGRWRDPAGQPNNYQLTGLFRYILPCTNCQNNPNYKETEQFTTLYFDESNKGLQTDQSTNGGEMISGRAFLGYSYYSGGGSNQPNFGSQYKSATVTVNLLNTDRAYYQYQDAIARQSDVSGNPFAEPVIIPTNIQGGFGCFAGYNRSTITLKLK